MANKYLEASAAIGTSGGEIRVQKMSFSGSHATAIGTVELYTGGAGGTKQWKAFVGPGSCEQIDIPYIKADYVTIANAVVTVEFLTGRTG